MNVLLRIAAVVAVLALAAVGVSSQATAQDGQQVPQQVELTAQQIEAFLASYPEVEALGEEFEREYGSVDVDPEDPTSAFTAYSRYADARERMEGIMRRHGIASMEEWTRLAYSVMLAYSFAEQGEDIGSMDQEMDSAIAQIEGDDSIPAEQKEQLIAMLRMQVEQISQLRPPPGNIELAAQYADRIRTIVDDVDDEE